MDDKGYLGGYAAGSLISAAHYQTTPRQLAQTGFMEHSAIMQVTELDNCRPLVLQVRAASALKSRALRRSPCKPAFSVLDFSAYISQFTETHGIQVNIKAQL